MRQTAIGVVLGSLAVMCISVLNNYHETAYAQHTGSAETGAAGVIAFQKTVSETTEQLTLIDPVRRTLCIYHVSNGTGTLTLKSVRNFHWDLQLLEFNGTEPSPKDIRSMVSSN